VAKKPALSTQLKNAQAQIAELEKSLTSSKSSVDYHRRQTEEAQSELNQVHAFFDALPDSLPRRHTETHQPHSAMTRLAAWLANK
jgi:septal ring factor EnvC (AmiA/AmiB activator)